MTRVALIGYGAVAAIHARELAAAGATLAAVCGPDEAKARAFAEAHGCGCAVSDLRAACEKAEVAVVASPSALHCEQALEALKCGLPVLVELPACASPEEARRLGAASAKAKLALQCAHTARYAEPYRRLGKWIAEGRLGEIVQVNYFRSIQLKTRSWIDDALLHHTSHPVDLLLHWFGSVRPCGAAAWPRVGPASEASILAQLPSGGPATVAVSYTASLPASRMTVVGSLHTAVTDGFSFLDSDESGASWRGDPKTVYEKAVGEQDREFLGCCRDGRGAIAWSETTQLVDFLAKAVTLCKST